MKRIPSLVTVAGLTILAGAIDSRTDAAAPMLSPRAQSIQISKVAGVANDPNLIGDQSIFLMPRSKFLQPRVVAGSSKNDPVLVNHPEFHFAGKNTFTRREFQLAPAAPARRHSR